MSSLTPDETILGLLAVQAQHGYDLLECFRSNHQLGRVWYLSTSQIYAVLKRLERQGWIVGHEVASEVAPTRTEYKLTKTGEKHLYDWLNDPQPSASIRRIRVEFLSRLYILRQLNIPTNTVVGYQREACTTHYAHLVSERDNTEHGIDVLALELQISQLDAVLRWIERCEHVTSEPDNS
ncbi:MAG TPA: PadR family transcriptional regulator [Aggregatilineales bacterium]|nr:PadR family transcriptional regulator [Anaerolineales bacterium]HRE46244.1 PadR family transcriptional regulator [Aggregatilineales bacterium]